jgi:hypothetical protein
MQEKEQFMKGPRIKRNNYILFDRKVVKKKKMDEYLYIDRRLSIYRYRFG